MPHYDPEGLLTGAKIREVTGQRVSKEGSKYDALYGAWRAPTRDVLLCEGETDMAWAAYTAVQEGLVNLTVYALPRGARSPATAEQLSFLRTARTIYLAFDPDATGIEATRDWVAGLAGATGQRAVRWCRLPLGKDLRDAKPKLTQLLANAQMPLQQPTRIQALPGGYVITNDKGDAQIITNWTVEPIATLVGGEEGPGYQLTLLHRGIEREEVIRHADLASVSKLRAWCANRGLYFTCTDRYVGLVAEHLEWRASLVPEVFQTSRVGMHMPPEDYAFAPPSIVWPGGYSGTLPWLYAPGPRKANLEGQVLLPGDGGRFDWSWLTDFLELSDPSVTHTLISWVCAAARRPEIRDFPILFIGGPSGSGKSTRAKLMLRMAGSKIETQLGGITPYILMQRLSSTTSLPVFVDEWTRMSRKDTREAMQGMMPMIYEGGIAERGTADLNAVRYRMTAPVILAGEDTLHMDREIDRVVAVQPRAIWQSYAALDRIATAPLERFGSMLHWFVSSSGAPLLPLAPPQSADRVSHNREVLRGGWYTLLALLEYAGEAGENVPRLPDEPVDPATVEGMGEEDRENVYEAAVCGAAVMRDSATNPVCWVDAEGRGTWVRFDALIKVVDSNLDIELPGRSKAALQYFRGRYRVTPGRTTPPESFKTFRAHLIHGFHLTDTPNGG
jgi:energy-coupling factor transporter ATP-binding protein EcfA2